MILGSSLTLCALSVLSSACIHVPSHGCGTNKTDSADLGMIEERIDDGLAAIDQVQHAFRQPDLIHQFEYPPHGERHPLRGLQDKRISGGDRVRQKPERNHSRKIKRNDCGDYTQRLPDHSFVDASSHVFQVVALHHHWNSASHLDVFDSATPLGFGFRESLAVLLGEDAAEFVHAIFKKLLQLE